jgi:hypothetical protein
MSTRSSCCVLNTGPASWLFENYAYRLSQALDIEVSATPRDYNYVLGLHEEDVSPMFSSYRSFVPYQAILEASDKRKLAKTFLDEGVHTPETHLVESIELLHSFLAERKDKEWCLKFPISCGGAGHCLLKFGFKLPAQCPLPYVVQEFVRLSVYEVYRVYGYGNKLGAFNVRYYPHDVTPSPWVAHARGARYRHYDKVNKEAGGVSLRALEAINLSHSFGVIDLLLRPNGEWVVLEVGTDGIFTHVDCDFEDERREKLHFQMIAEAFHAWCK